MTEILRAAGDSQTSAPSEISWTSLILIGAAFASLALFNLFDARARAAGRRKNGAAVTTVLAWLQAAAPQWVLMVFAIWASMICAKLFYSNDIQTFRFLALALALVGIASFAWGVTRIVRHVRASEW